MANKKHLEILKQGFSAWNQWRQNNSEVKPDLSNLDFRELYKPNDPPVFEEYNFTEANLNNAIIRDLAFDNCDFSNANCEHSNLYNSRFVKCKLINICMKGVTIEGSQFLECNLTNADFSVSQI